MTFKIFPFSGYVEGIFPIKNIDVTSTICYFTVILPLKLKNKIKEKEIKFADNFFMSVDGVPAKIVNITITNEITIACEILFSFYNQNKLKFINEMYACISLQSTSIDEYLIEHTPIGIAKLASKTLAYGHSFTQELTFEISTNLYSLIRHHKYIALNGSSFFIQEVIKNNVTSLLTIHVGQLARDHTMLDNVPIGYEFNLSLPFIKN